MRYCLRPRCPEVVEGKGSYCPEHQPYVEPWAGSKSERDSWEARRVRARVLRRDNHRCTWTEPDGSRCRSVASEVDAVVPSAEGGSHTDPSNLRSLCSEHHRIKTEQDRRRGVDRSVQRRRRPRS